MPQDITRQKSVTKALVTLGSNVASAIGGSPQVVQAAIRALDGELVQVDLTSRLFVTPCFPTGAGPDYINAAVSVTTSLSARGLLDYLHALEHRFERTREVRWGARTLDLDLLDFGGSLEPDAATWQAWRDLPPDLQRSVAPDKLVLPHPRIQDRAFVLVPLLDIAPDWVHPVTGRSVTGMCDDLDAEALAGIKPCEIPESLALPGEGG